MDALFRLLSQANPDAGLLWLRLAGSALLLQAHGWSKLAHYSKQLTRIEDPFGLGATVSMFAAIFAEVACPVLIALGLFTWLACLPGIAVLAVAMLAVHPEWSTAEGQFG